MPGFLNAEEVVVNSMTEEQWAETLRRQGKHVISHRGRYWMELVAGFYEPIHWLAALTENEATRPRFGCWGFRTRLKEAPPGLANGTMPVQLCSNVADYGEQSLTPGRRNHLRRCRKRIRIVQLKDACLLRDQGRRVMLSAIRRTDYGHAPEQEAYCSEVDVLVRDPHMVVLAGLAGDQLAGYMIGYAVGDVAYIQNIFLATEFLNTYVGTGLPFEFVLACRRTGMIHQVVYGLHSVEDPRLCTFKAGMGFPPVYLPSRVSLPPVVSTILRYRYPYKFYRLTGQHPTVGEGASTSFDTGEC
ncbi:MAG TPA: hypothetical protein PK614_07960 [Nitrospira sp.]|mgnify:CR=1 FL=1|jgi:hypothetical protein|nr:hypothetical protein [Nitrospira sp.]